MRRTALIVLGVAVFLAASALLARHLSFEGGERELLVAALQAQPRAGGEDVEVLRLDSATAYSLGPARGTSRIAWRRPATDQTYVQCADVERTGSVVSARRIIVHRLSEPIGLEASC